MDSSKFIEYPLQNEMYGLKIQINYRGFSIVGFKALTLLGTIAFCSSVFARSLEKSWKLGVVEALNRTKFMGQKLMKDWGYTYYSTAIPGRHLTNFK